MFEACVGIIIVAYCCGKTHLLFHDDKTVATVQLTEAIKFHVHVYHVAGVPEQFLLYENLE